MQVHLVKFAGRRPPPAHLLPRPRDRRLVPAHAAATTSSSPRTRAADEFGQVYRYDLATGDVTLLTDGGRSQNSRRPLVARRRPHRLRLHPPQRQGPRPLRHRPRRPDQRPPAGCRCEGGGWSVADWSPDDKQLARGRVAISANESYLWLVDAASGAEDGCSRPRAAPRRSPTAAAQFSSDGKGALRHHRPASPSSSAWPASTSPPATHTYLDSHDQLGRRATSSSRRTARPSPSSPTKTASACCTCSTRPPARRGRAQSCPAWASIGGAGVAPERQGPGLHASPRALALRRLLARRRDRQGRALDGERDRRPRRLAASPSRSWSAGRASTAATISRLPLPPPAARSPARGRWSSTSTAGPRASRGPTSSAATTTSSTSWAWPSSSPTCAAPPATARRS